MSEIRPLEVTWDACERMVTDILDEAKIPSVPEEPDDAQMAARLHWLADDWSRLRAEVERLRGALESVYASMVGLHEDMGRGEPPSWRATVGSCMDRLSAALAGAASGDGEVRPAPRDGTCCSCGDASPYPVETPCQTREDRTHCPHWYEVEEDHHRKASGEAERDLCAGGGEHRWVPFGDFVTCYHCKVLQPERASAPEKTPPQTHDATCDYDACSCWGGAEKAREP